MNQHLVAILPCNDMDLTQAFFLRLGFEVDDEVDGYRMMSDGFGASIHLTVAESGWLIPGRNPFGLYLYREDVDALAAAFAGEIVEADGPSIKPWGMYEFALNGPDETLVRVGWPSAKRLTE
ncbi:glyoxalase [Sphingomonas adhaesiva]|uniref:glyoxalase n=1 Tax=Sphingomonas adhaesiva TaxID=28212 RepID=UPI002FF986ED